MNLRTSAGGGPAGESVSLATADDWIVWRQGDGPWENLVPFSAIKGPPGEPGDQGAPGTPGSPGTPGAAGVVGYNASGSLPALKVWMGTATADAAGAFSASFSTAAFSSVHHVDASVRSAANNGLVTVASLTFNTSGCSGTCRGALNLLGVLTLGLNNISGSVIAITAWGN